MNKITSNKKLLALTSGALLLFGFFFTSCNKDNGTATNSGSSSTTMKMTDAAADDSAIKAVVVTIADIRLDGQSVQGFQRTTVRISDYKNGSILNLGTFNLRNANYSNITFVLDYNTDANGQVPGSYYMTFDSVKHQLQSSTSTITVSKSFSLYDSISNSIVFDFDLRKMITYQPGDSTHYTFVSGSELQNALRYVDGNHYSTISGTLTNSISTDSDMVKSWRCSVRACYYQF
jgi:Domain of unknown function (DUF4382)